MTAPDLTPELEGALARLKGMVRPDAECDAREAELRAERVTNLREDAGFPARAWAFVRSGQPERYAYWAEKAKKLRELMARPDGCLAAIVGPQGTGKTCLAVRALCDLSETLRVVRFTDVAGLVAELRDAHVAGRLMATLESWEQPAGLVLDQWDKGPASDWESRYLFRLLDRRYNQGRWTILVANVPPLTPALEAMGYQHPARATAIAEAFGALVGPSLLGRINETGGLIVTDWATLR